MTRLLLLSGAVALGTWMQGSSESDSADVVQEWFDAMNGLDGTDESVERFVSLYQADALHITGPEDHQIGTVTFDGMDSLRVMVTRFHDTYENISFRIDVVTVNEISRRLFHRAQGPWGGESVAVQFSAAYTRREDGVRYTVPGAAFFRIESGKIRRARLYLPDGERAEVERPS